MATAYASSTERPERIDQGDLFAVPGASFSNQTGIVEYEPTMHVDHDAMTHWRFHGGGVPVWGEIRDIDRPHQRPHDASPSTNHESGC